VEAGAVELVSCGAPAPGTDLEVRGPDGGLGEGHVGRIFVRSPSLLREYFGRPGSPLVDGWLDTGDLGFLRDGELFVTGRAKDVIVIRGQNHSPQEVERAVDAVAGVRSGCAAAVAEVGEGGERLLLFVERRGPAAGAPPGLADECRRAVRAATGVEPDEVIVLEPGTLPRTSSGKMRRGEALRRWQAGTLGPPAPVTRLRLVQAMARSALAYLFGR